MCVTNLCMKREAAFWGVLIVLCGMKRRNLGRVKPQVALKKAVPCCLVVAMG